MLMQTECNFKLWKVVIYTLTIFIWSIKFDSVFKVVFLSICLIGIMKKWENKIFFLFFYHVFSSKDENVKE